jgi:hypothetical protein
MYTFVTNWSFDAPIEAVWAELHGVEQWPGCPWKECHVMDERNRISSSAGSSANVTRES